MQDSYFRKRLGTVLNLSITVFTVSIAVLLAKQYLFTSEPKILKVGDKISIEGTLGDARRRSLLLFLRSGCVFCTKSADFYTELSKDLATSESVRMVAVFSSSDDQAKDYLTGLGLSDISLVRVSYSDLGVEGTPTMALIDREGFVKDVWIGKLSHRRQVDVKQKLGLAVESWYVEESEVNEFKNAGQNVEVIDTQSREYYAMNHFKGSKNIPADELSIRGINELSSDDLIVVYGNSEKDGEVAKEILLKDGFKKVFILNYKFQNSSVPTVSGN